MQVRRDPGLQPERTGLAWQRVALAVMICSALVARSLVDPAIGVAVAVLVSGLIAAVVIVVNATRRERGTLVQVAGGDAIVPEEGPGQVVTGDHVAGTGKRFAMISIFSIVLSGLGLVAVLL